MGYVEYSGSWSIVYAVSIGSNLWTWNLQPISLACYLQFNVINLRNAFESPPLKKGDLGGFSNGDKKSPLAPFF
jgi:hypothetical protein